MEEYRIDAVIITGTDPHSSEYPAERWKQVEWVCGFTGEAGDVVITRDHAGLWTDTRYFIQAATQLEGTGVELHKTRIPGEVRIPEWLADYAFSRMTENVVIAIDGLAQSAASIDEIKKAFANSGRQYDQDLQIKGSWKIVSIPNMLDRFWSDRPAIPSNPIITIGSDIAGEARSCRIARLRVFLEEKECDAILLTSLDEIAWVLNVRGSDIEYNPLAISYLLVTRDAAFWYVRKPGVCDDDPETSSTYSEVEDDGVVVKDYEDLFSELYQASDMCLKTLYVDPQSLNYQLVLTLESTEGQIKTIEGVSPVIIWKSVKNEVEIAGMKQAHLEDAIIMEKFLYWLESKVNSGEEISEWDAAMKLDSLRATIPGCRGNSFQTISAYGHGAALPHYVTPRIGSTILEPHGLYLCDSGGQFLFGTTDITRTVPLGPCTEQEMEDYTLVLKGHIGLATAVFPAGTSGCQIDYAARSPLWKYARNFGHGTGHGVGFFLNVHEGPQEIRHNHNSQPLLPGMITSDEPGIYREGQYGIRHESLLLCIEAGSNEFGEWRCFENLTLCHIDTSAVLPDMLTKEETAWLNSYNEEVFRTLSPRLPSDIAEWLRIKTLPI